LRSADRIERRSRAAWRALARYADLGSSLPTEGSPRSPPPGPALEERDRAQPTKTTRSLVPVLGPAVGRGRITPSRGTRQGGAHHDAEDAAANRLLRGELRCGWAADGRVGRWGLAVLAVTGVAGLVLAVHG